MSTLLLIPVPLLLSLLLIPRFRRFAWQFMPLSGSPSPGGSGSSAPLKGTPSPQGQGGSAPLPIFNSLFRLLFSDRVRAAQLIHVLHPELGAIDSTRITFVTLQPQDGYGVCNDLGILYDGRLLILIESETSDRADITNMSFRLLKYVILTIDKLLPQFGMHEHQSVPLKLPAQELITVYVGPKNISEGIVQYDALQVSPLQEARPGASVKIITTSHTSNILGQYISACHIIRNHFRQSGRTKEAALEAFGECIGQGILEDFLLYHKEEVIQVATSWFETKDGQQYIQAERNIAAQQAVDRASRIFAAYCGLSVEKAKEILNGKAPG